MVATESTKVAMFIPEIVATAMRRSTCSTRNILPPIMMVITRNTPHNTVIPIREKSIHWMRRRNIHMTSLVALAKVMSTVVLVEVLPILTVKLFFCLPQNLSLRLLFFVEPKYHLITPHVTHYGMPTGGHDLDLGHHGLSLEHGIGGALGHHDLAHYSDHSPLYSDSQHIPVPGANVVYAPSPLTSATEGESVNTRKSIPLISTKLSPSPLSVPQSSTATDLYPLTSSSSNVERSAVHATPPALISTNNGVHYYSS